MTTVRSERLIAGKINSIKEFQRFKAIEIKVKTICDKDFFPLLYFTRFEISLNCVAEALLVNSNKMDSSEVIIIPS